MELKKIAEEMQPKSMAARDWVFQVIRTAIVRGVLPGDMPLRQDEISSALSVSHIPVREAFRQLEAQGLVRIYPNRGAVVTKLSKYEMENVMNVRIMLEKGAVCAAIPRLKDEDIEKAYNCLNAFANEKDYNRLDELNLQLHYALYMPCDNPLLISFIDQLHANVDRYMHPFYSEAYDKDVRSLDEHKALIDACAAHDVELASRLIEEHLIATRKILISSPILS